MSLYRIPEELLNETIHDVVNANAVSGINSLSPIRGMRGISNNPFWWKSSISKGRYNKDKWLSTQAVKRTVQNELNRTTRGSDDYSNYADGRCQKIKL